MSLRILGFLLLLPFWPVHAQAATTNVLFIVSDDLRAGVLGCYGDKLCATPNIDRLAARGVVFERAYCQGTVCGPVSYEGDGSDQPDAKTAVKTVELLRQVKAGGKPFLLAAGFVRPHYPMVAPRPYFDRYPHETIELPHVPEGDLDDIPPLGISGSNSKKNGLAQFPENQQRMWSGYYASVTFMDAQLGLILDELDRLGLAESTAIVFTSDHGYHLGDHTFWQKAVFSYDGQHHSLRSDRWAFIRYSDGTEELYDMKSDPGQHTNLAGHSGHIATLEGMRAQLQAHLQKQKPEGKGKRKGKK